VHVSGRTQARVDEAISRTGGSDVKGVGGDLSTRAGCDGLIARIRRLDVLVNNFTTFDVKPVLEISDDDWMHANGSIGCETARSSAFGCPPPWSFACANRGLSRCSDSVVRRARAFATSTPTASKYLSGPNATPKADAILIRLRPEPPCGGWPRRASTLRASDPRAREHASRERRAARACPTIARAA